MLSTSSSNAITSSVSSKSRWTRALSAPRSARRTSDPSSWRLASSWSSSSWKVVRTFSLAKAPRHVVLGPLVGWRGEDLRSLFVFDEHTGAAPVVHLEAEERRPVRDPRGLLHV